MGRRAWKPYLDFILKIEPQAGGGFRVEARGPAGEARADFTLPFDEKDLKIFLLQLKQQRRKFGRGYVPKPAEDTVRFGRRLYDAVICDAVRDRFVASRQIADQKHRGLRLRLCLGSHPLLIDTPWEFLCADDQFLALSRDLPLVHYLELPNPPRPLQLNLPVRILATVSAPHSPDFPELNADIERDRIRAALDKLIAAGQVALDFTPDAGLATLAHSLRAAAAAGRPYHVWHFIGHGGFDPLNQGSVLVLTKDDGAASLVNGFQLGTLFSDYPEIRLALLNSCEGARSESADPFNGVAAALVRRGIPAVIGMQFEISDTAAVKFSEEFYTALADGLPVDAAVTEARRGVFFQENWVEWATPVLYLRSPNGKLFTIQQSEAEPSQPASPVETQPPPVAPQPPSARDRLEHLAVALEDLSTEVAPLQAMLPAQEEIDRFGADLQRLSGALETHREKALALRKQFGLSASRAVFAGLEKLRLGCTAGSRDLEWLASIANKLDLLSRRIAASQAALKALALEPPRPADVDRAEAEVHELADLLAASAAEIAAAQASGPDLFHLADRRRDLEGLERNVASRIERLSAVGPLLLRLAVIALLVAGLAALGYFTFAALATGSAARRATQTRLASVHSLTQTSIVATINATITGNTAATRQAGTQASAAAQATGAAATRLASPPCIWTEKVIDFTYTYNDTSFVYFKNYGALVTYRKDHEGTIFDRTEHFWQCCSDGSYSSTETCPGASIVVPNDQIMILNGDRWTRVTH